MFFHLAKALVVLEHGPKSLALLEQPVENDAFNSDETSADGTADQNLTESSASHPPTRKKWKPIVHNDIKPQK